MPEIMSAKEFSQVMEDCVAIEGDEFCGYNSKQCRNAIYSRDSAMLEKYKEAMCNNCGNFCTTQNLARCSCRKALDSAFAEIEGGK